MYKKRNGFTLIELLAVIIIIGLIAVIIIPKVNKTLKDSKDAVNKASVNGLVRTANNYYLEKRQSGFQGCSYDFETNENTCTGLEFIGEKPEEGKLRIDIDGNISIAAKFDKKCYIKNSQDENIISRNYEENNCIPIILTAQQIEYTTTHNSNVSNIKEALDDLYGRLGN